jgi:hypothetical protein
MGDHGYWLLVIITTITLFTTHLDNRHEGAGPAGGEGREEMVLDLSQSPPPPPLIFT